MTAAELERIARSIIPPVGATMAIARVGGQLKHRAAFLIDGRIHGEPVGPAFDRPKDAIRLVDLLNGEAPRRAPQPDLAHAFGEAVESRDVDAAPAEAPDLGQALTLGLADAPAGTCAGCGGPLPPGRHGQRRLTCSDRCRRAVARRPAAGAVGADPGSASSPVTPSRPAPG